ncbi:MAG: GNAT family N-acetyltransferase [Burkholderiales bacterium]
MLVDLATASELFASLPPEQQWPTLSPAYVAADAQRDLSLAPVFLVSRQGGGLLLHCVHEGRIDQCESRDWQSAYGYGGPLVHGLDAASLSRAWTELDAHAAARGVVAEFVRFHPGLDGHLVYPGNVRADRAVVEVDLRVADLLASYSGRARNAIRKAERAGLSVEQETAQDARAKFPAFYRRSMAEIGASAFYLFGDDYFDALLTLPGARVFSVRRSGERLSMGLFLFGPTQVEYHLSGTSSAGREVGATNLLLHGVAQAAREVGSTMLYLGGGTSAAASDPLLRFKVSFAPATLRFCIGHRVHDAQAYARLRAAHPERAANSNRVLFYRE